MPQFDHCNWIASGRRLRTSISPKVRAGVESKVATCKMLNGEKRTMPWAGGEDSEGTERRCVVHRRKRIKARGHSPVAVRRSKRQSRRRKARLRSPEQLYIPIPKVGIDVGTARKKQVDHCTDDEVAIVAEIIRSAKRIVAIVGAGISTSSGIPDFRSAGGLYSIVEKLELDLPQPECLFDIRYFKDDPVPFYSFLPWLYSGKKRGKAGKGLGKAHIFLRKLEEKRKLQRVYTQNIDNLEAQAGIEKVVYCHGRMDTCKCLSCKECTDTSSYTRQIAKQQVLKCRRMMPHGRCGGLLKPNITFFGEKLPKKIDSAVKADAGRADLIIVSGTSMKVAPVSTLPSFFPKNVPVVVVNNVRVDFPTHPEVSCTNLIGDCDSIFTRIAEYLAWD